MLIQLLIVLLCIIVGARLGGMGLGVMGGLGVALLTFVFGLQPGALPIDVMLMIAAVISAIAVFPLPLFPIITDISGLKSIVISTNLEKKGSFSAS